MVQYYYHFVSINRVIDLMRGTIVEAPHRRLNNCFIHNMFPKLSYFDVAILFSLTLVIKQTIAI